MILAGCGGGGGTSNPTPTATAIPTTTATAQTTSTPGATPTPTATPNATPTTAGNPAPTATQTPAPTPTPARIRVACVGDSITYGLHITDPNVNSYPIVLARKLGDSYLVRNFGSPGATLLNNGSYPYQGRKEFAQALAFAPDIVIVELGTNDTKTPFTEAQNVNFVTDYGSLITQFKQANPSAKIYVCLPIPIYPQTSLSNRILLSSILRLVQHAADDTGATVIDLNTPFTNRPDLYYDQYHPTIEGDQLLASVVYNSLVSARLVSAQVRRIRHK